MIPRRERLADVLRIVRGWKCETCYGGGQMKYPGGGFWIRCPVCKGMGSAPPMTDPRETWETLATQGIVPMDWVDDERRVFAWREPCPVCGGRCTVDPDRWVRSNPPAPPRPRERCVRCEGRGYKCDGLTPHPATLVAIVAIAADVPGILAAEGLAHEAAAIVGRAPERVVWRVGEHDGKEAWVSTAPHVADLSDDELRASAQRRKATETAIHQLGYHLDEITDSTAVLVAPELT